MDSYGDALDLNNKHLVLCTYTYQIIQTRYTLGYALNVFCKWQNILTIALEMFEGTKVWQWVRYKIQTRV